MLVVCNKRQLRTNNEVLFGYIDLLEFKSDLKIIFRQRSVSCYVMKRSSINEPSYSYQVSRAQQEL